MLNLQILSTRLNMCDVLAMVEKIEKCDELRCKMFDLLSSDDERVASNVAWIFTHSHIDDWLQFRQSSIVDLVLKTKNSTLLRLLLVLLSRQNFDSENIRGDFYDFCIKCIMSSVETRGIRSICIKLAYMQSRFFVELIDELKSVLEDVLSIAEEPSVQSAAKNVLKKINKQYKN